MAEVEDRTHELSFGNRLRAGSPRSAGQINDLIATIEQLAPLVAAGKHDADPAKSGRPCRMNTGRSPSLMSTCRRVMHGGRVGAEDPTDDKDGLREFSRPRPVACRRERGHHNAY